MNSTQGGCPTCSHTMVGIGHVPPVGGEPIFWCPRCGTIEDHTNEIVDVVAPKLVDRCREFGTAMAARQSDAAELLQRAWQRLGIAESIHRPEYRT